VGGARVGKENPGQTDLTRRGTAKEDNEATRKMELAELVVQAATGKGRVGPAGQKEKRLARGLPTPNFSLL